MKFFSPIILFLCILACHDSKENNAQDLQADTRNLAILKGNIAKLNYIEFVLDIKAEKALKDWEKHYELQEQMTNLKQGNLSFFRDNLEFLDIFLNDFKTTVPDTVNTTSIMARITALETKMYKLESVVNLDNTNEQKLLEAIEELLISSSNLNLQINKKFEKESQNIQKPQ